MENRGRYTRVDMKCNNCSESNANLQFTNLDGYTKLLTYLETSIEWMREGENNCYGGVGLLQRFFRCSMCGRLWRLVEPDAPFRGLWERIEE